MRYSVILKGLPISQLQLEVQRCGGKNLRVLLASKQVFCDLDDTNVTKLQLLGCSVNKVGGVQTVISPPVDVSPPTPLVGTPKYTPLELLGLAGLEDLRNLMAPPIYGEGFNLAIIDTGIRESHSSIKGRVIYRKNYTSDVMRDDFNHGTGVCSIALSVAPLSNILNLKVLDKDGVGTEEEVALAIDDCISLLTTNPSIAPHVINLSLGSLDDGNINNPIRVVCREAISQGIWVLASAGNLGPTNYSVTCPACEEYVAAIGSIKYSPEENTFIISNFSSRGPTQEGLIKPDLVFFGEDIIMASSVSDIATIAKSGTSFSTPIYSGVAIEYLEGMSRVGEITWPDITDGAAIYPVLIQPVTEQEMLEEYLGLICGRPEGVTGGKDYEYGYGMPYGPLVLQYLSPVGAVEDISVIMSSFIPIIGFAMILPVMKSMFQGKRTG